MPFTDLFLCVKGNAAIWVIIVRWSTHLLATLLEWQKRSRFSSFHDTYRYIITFLTFRPKPFCAKFTSLLGLIVLLCAALLCAALYRGVLVRSNDVLLLLIQAVE